MMISRSGPRPVESRPNVDDTQSEIGHDDDVDLLDIVPADVVLVHVRYCQKQLSRDVFDRHWSEAI